MLISLVEYAERNGREQSTARRHAIAGRFQTRQKIGRNWVIDENEPWPEDSRKENFKEYNEKRRAKIKSGVA